MKKNKNLWIGLGVVVVIVLIFWFMNKSSDVVSVDNSQTTMNSTEDTTTGSVDMNSSVSISYTNALAKYKATRIQLDDACQADAQNQKMTVKNNTNIMVDNRSSATRTIKLGSVFTIKPYGFKIVNISSAKIPTTWLLDCDTHQNVATISVQK